MNVQELLICLAEGTILEGPHWTEPVKVLNAKLRGNRVELQAVGLNTKRHWTKLLTADDFDGKIVVTQAGTLAALNGNPTHFRQMYLEKISARYLQVSKGKLIESPWR